MFAGHGETTPAIKTTTVYQVDLDIDSNNNHAFAFAGFDDAEDKIEASEKPDAKGNKPPGKIVISSSLTNSDSDDVPDFADGFNLAVGSGKIINELAHVSDTLQFVPVQVELKEPFNTATAKVKFTYDPASKPELSADGIAFTGSGTTEDPYVFHLNKGGMRLWRKKSTERTSCLAVPNGDFIPADTQINWTDIATESSTPRVAKLYLEYIETSPAQAAGRRNFAVTATENSAECKDTANITLLPVEVAPEVLAVNSDFDEGRIDPATGYAIPDCDDADIALEAVRNHLDGKFAINERVTEDMHLGFFGVNPSNLGDDFWAGANVTIRKIDKTDPATGHPESGHIRLYGKWGSGPSEYRAITPYDFETLATTNLATGGINGASAESVYGTASPFPDGTSYFIEGVHPGKITLEWRYQKGSLDFKHEQSFEVCTHKNAIQWKHDLAYKIRLETSNDPSGEINTIAVMFPSESYRERMERASEYYDFYQDCFLTPLRSKPLQTQAITWPGLARLAGSQVVGGLSDSEYARMLLEAGTIPGYVLPQSIQDDLLQWSLSETKDLQQALFTGARTIFQSIGWQMHAYRSSGYRALDWVAAETGEVEVDALVRAGVWKDLRIGILNHDKSLLDGAALRITDREQNVTIVPTWGVISGLFLGTTNWMFSVLGENSCTPSGIRFSDLFPQFPVPTGSLTNTADRWTWIRPTTTNGILDTWNKLPTATRDTLVRRTLEQDARRFSLISHFPHPLPTPVVALPVWVWDNEDVK